MNDIKLFKQSSIRIDNVYIDPYCVDEYYHDAKYVFITHSHYDHFSYEDIIKVSNDETIFVAPEDVPTELINCRVIDNKLIIVKPNNTYEMNDINFSTTYAYNIKESFHLKKVIGLAIY